MGRAGWINEAGPQLTASWLVDMEASLHALKNFFLRISLLYFSPSLNMKN
jgi:hypothetical protein